MGGEGGMGGAGGMAGGLQIDRVGRPAVSTALIPSDMKNAYNQDDARAAGARPGASRHPPDGG
ncbi:MAG: hypothetical protein R3F60_23995 [bacterium]